MVLYKKIFSLLNIYLFIYYEIKQLFLILSHYCFNTNRKNKNLPCTIFRSRNQIKEYLHLKHLKKLILKCASYRFVEIIQ